MTTCRCRPEPSVSIVYSVGVGDDGRIARIASDGVHAVDSDDRAVVCVVRCVHARRAHPRRAGGASDARRDEPRPVAVRATLERGVLAAAGREGALRGRPALSRCLQLGDVDLRTTEYRFDRCVR